MVRSLALLVVSFSLLGCGDTPPEERLAQLKKEIENKISATTKSVDELTPSKEEVHKLTSEEFEKLSQFEYTVIEVENSPASPASRESLEKTLLKAGQERWDCISTINLAEKILIICKRKPSSYLHYLPRMFP